MEQQIIVYEPNDKTKMEVKTDGETVWLTIEQMSILFGRDPSVIGKHIKAAFSEEELDNSINRQNLPINGRGRPVTIYDLDVVISVGYRVKSIEGTRFRRWATHTLRDMLLRRIVDMRRVDRLESRMDKAESTIQRIEGGVNYLVKQLTAPPKQPKRNRIGFHP